MASLNNFNCCSEIYDCCLWYGTDSTNPEVNSDLKLLSNHTDSLNKIFNDVKLFINSLYSVYYDPIEGDIALEGILKKNKDNFLGTIIFPSHFILEKKGFEKYLGKKIKSGFKMLRLLPKNHKYSVDAWAFKYFYEILNRWHFPVVISLDELDITGNKQINWKYFYDLAQKYPDIPIILDGGNAKEMVFSGYLFQVLQNTGNVYLNIHNLFAFNQVEEIVQQFGAGKLLFDSNLPFYPEEMVIRRIGNARIINEDRSKIFGGNMKNIIKRITVY
ncbi:MAG: hypothetical protein FJW68_09355 [Actinobacteria bacterium]|nr:hypothetical protein [Actinomycetota bacterium]